MEANCGSDKKCIVASSSPYIKPLSDDCRVSGSTYGQIRSEHQTKTCFLYILSIFTQYLECSNSKCLIKKSYE